MKRALIVGNWKSHKTVSEVSLWFTEAVSHMPKSHATVVLCPSFPFLPVCSANLQQHRLPWKLGAQDVSSFPVGKHTGEVNAVQLKDLVSYVLIGHSERRQQLGETDAMLFEKVKRAREAGLTPIFFVQGEETPIPEGIEVVAYEPVFAIGTGTPDTPEDAEKVAKFFKTKKHVPTVLYGGSVDSKNVSVFLSCPSIDGVVPGTASLDPKEFVLLINNA